MTNIENWRYYLKDIESPDLFIDWSFYSMISAALQRRAWFYEERFALYPNLYIFLVGPPATGKSRVIAQTGLIFKSTEMKWLNTGKNPPEEEDRFPLGADRITKEKLAQDLARYPKILMRAKENGIKVPYISAPKYFILEELGTLLGKNADDIVDVLNQLYDSRDFIVQTKGQGDDFVRNVCVSILAGTTPSAIQTSFSNQVMSQGFTSRIILVFASAPRFFREFPGLDEKQKEAIKIVTEQIKKIHDKPVFGQVKLSAEAAAFHKEIYESGQLYENRLNTDFRLDDYYGRKKVHWLKTAMAMHFGEELGLEIQKPTMEAALDLLNRTEVEMHRSFTSAGVGSVMAVAESVARLVRQAGPLGMKKLAVYLHFTQNNVSKEVLTDAIASLIDLNRLVVETKPGVGVVYTVRG